MYQPSFITFFSFLCLALVLLLHTNNLPICSGLSVMDLNILKHSETGVVVSKRVCKKSIVECLEEQEILMDSESSRRVLEAVQQQHRYISYETLKRDMVPCHRAGASYYSCNAKQANPYSRGCEVITGCARGVQPIKT